MTDQLTDDALAKRAEELANERYPFPDDKPSFDTHIRQLVHVDATLSALKVHRDGLRLLIELTEDHHSRCKCDAHPHIASLRELLGVSQ